MHDQPKTSVKRKDFNRRGFLKVPMAAAAVGLASMAYAKQARRRTIRGIDARTADRINALSERGSQVLRRLRNIADEAGKRYPKVREAVRG